MSIAANIQFARRARGMSEPKLADALGVDVNYVRLLEHGHVQPSGQMATRLADALLARREKFVEDLPVSLKPGD